MYLCGKPVEAGGPVLAHRSHAWKPDSTGGHSLKNGKPVCAGGPVLDLREALQEGGPVIELDKYAWRPVQAGHFTCWMGCLRISASL